MLYSEFLKGTGGINCPQNYDEFRKLEAVYMLIDGMTKEDICKQANVVKENNTTPQVEFLAAMLNLKKHYADATGKNSGEAYWFFRDAEIEADCIVESVVQDATFENYIFEHATIMRPTGPLKEKTYEAVEMVRAEVKEIAVRLGIISEKKKTPS